MFRYGEDAEVHDRIPEEQDSEKEEIGGIGEEGLSCVSTGDYSRITLSSHTSCL